MLGNFSKKFRLFLLQKATGDRSGRFGKSGIDVGITSFKAEERRIRDAFGDVARFQETADGAIGRSNENAEGIFTNIKY